MLTFAAATATGDTSTLKPEQHEQKATRITQGYLALDKSPPGLLWMFGERGYHYVDITFLNGGEWVIGERPLTAKEGGDLARVRRLFPEAKVVAFGYESSDHALSEAP
ncbi:MAG TPA: hypothetical protein VGJ26_04880 [Pirellulales bacterium]